MGRVKASLYDKIENDIAAEIKKQRDYNNSRRGAPIGYRWITKNKRRILVRDPDYEIILDKKTGYFTDTRNKNSPDFISIRDAYEYRDEQIRKNEELARKQAMEDRIRDEKLRNDREFVKNKIKNLEYSLETAKDSTTAADITKELVRLRKRLKRLGG